MEYYTDIVTALEELRPQDKLVKKISNKYAIVESIFTDGTFADQTVCGLINNEIKFHGTVQQYIDWFEKYGHKIPRVEYRNFAYWKDPQTKSGTVYRRTACDNRRYIKRARKLYWLLKTQITNEVNQ